MSIADFGAGRTGHIVFPASMLVGERGIVYAVDILRDVLGSLQKHAQMERLLNIHPVWSDVEQVGKTAIPSKTLDVVFIVNLLSQCNDIESVLQEAARLLKDKGRIVVVDWEKTTIAIAPPAQKLVDFAAIEQYAPSHGLFVQDSFLIGPYHRGLVLYAHR